jgi:hypothetical protein
MGKRKIEFEIATWDTETDPFKHGRTPRPFASGFYTEYGYREFWGKDCIDQTLDYIRSLDRPYMIYAHNGGKFDFFFLLEKGALQNPALIIDRRIVKCGIADRHQLRDSYAMIPERLAEYKKTEIDYSKLEEENRDANRPEILRYLHDDCRYLFELVSGFIKQFGAKVTIGSAAITELGKFHRVSRIRKRDHDCEFRDYYYGGRVECFEGGKLTGEFKMFDINSSYPNVMRNFVHPDCTTYITLFDQSAESAIDKDTGRLHKFAPESPYFCRFIGENRGALPNRNEKTNALEFKQTDGEFFACSHELRLALALKRVRIHKVLELRVASAWTRFDKFVDHWYARKLASEKNSLERIFTKRILNSSYGKFGTNVDKFKEYFILDRANDDGEFERWRLANDSARPEQDFGNFEIWCADAPDVNGYFDVAVAASITSAARANLLYALHFAKRPVYCDTDSLICESLDNVPIHDSSLGAWKCEGSGNTLYLAGKKLYAFPMYGGKVKIASKGVRLTLQDIQRICDGEEIAWHNEVPNFNWDFVQRSRSNIPANFISRNIRARIALDKRDGFM